MTEQVLAAYVQDRLDQLEGREKLDEEEAVELKFIRQNRHNLRYHIEGMKIDIYENAVETRGRYQADQMGKKRGKKGRKGRHSLDFRQGKRGPKNTLSRLWQ